MIKKFLRAFCPPLLWNVAVIIRRFILASTQKPKTYIVQSGPLKDGKLFINIKRRLFFNMYHGQYDDFFWEFLSNDNLNATTILDIGGHIGYHALCFSRLVGKDGKIFSFEPNPFNQKRIQTNLSINQELTDRIFLQSEAVGNNSGTAEFNFSHNVDDESSSGGFIDQSERISSSAIYSSFTKKLVSCLRLDDFANKHDLQNISVIKIDVEGAEALVLEGAFETIKKFEPTLLIEIHSVQAMDHTYRLLKNLGYDAKLLSVDRESRCFIGCRPSKNI